MEGTDCKSAPAKNRASKKNVPTDYAMHL